MVKRYTPLAARELLYGENSSLDALIAQGRLALEEERFGAATQFFCEARDDRGLGELQRLAVNDGDAFTLRAIAVAIPKLVTDADWGNLKANAERLGKPSMAGLAERFLSGDDDILEESGGDDEAETEG